MAGCATTGHPERNVSEINYDDGISKDEALTIAQNYIIDKIEGGENFYKKLIFSKAKIFEEWESEDKWAITIPISRGLAFIGPKEYILFINKKTGKTLGGGERK